MNDITGAGKLSEAIEKGTKEIRQLAYDFLAPGVKQAGEYIADKIRFTRFSSSIKTMEKAKEKLKAANLSPQVVDLKTLVPLIEFSSLEEDEDMIERWAGLLASASVQTGYMGYTLFRVHRLHSSPEIRIAAFCHRMPHRHPFNHIPYPEILFKKPAYQ